MDYRRWFRGRLFVAAVLLGWAALWLGLGERLPPAPAAQAGQQAANSIRPLSPDEELATFRVLKGFRVELVACEPQVADPVAMAFDEDGRIYVAEKGANSPGSGATVPVMSVHSRVRIVHRGCRQIEGRPASSPDRLPGSSTQLARGCRSRRPSRTRSTGRRPNSCMWIGERCTGVGSEIADQIANRSLLRYVE
jgi:hypothetical protein